MATIPEELVTSGVIRLLGTAIEVVKNGSSTPVPVGDHGTRDLDGQPIDTTGLYLVVRRIEGGRVEGSLGDGHQDVTLVYQVDSVATTRRGCEGLARKACAALTDLAAAGGYRWPLKGTGWVGGLRERQTTGMPESNGRDAGGEETWTQRERYEVTVHRA